MRPSQGSSRRRCCPPVLWSPRRQWHFSTRSRFSAGGASPAGWARRVGVAVALALLAFPGYALLFHQLASDALFAAGFALAALLTARLVEEPTYGRSAALGLGIALLVLIRPVGQVLVVLVPLVLLLSGAWRLRLGRLAILAAAVVLPLLGWAAHNAIRADDFTVVRGGGQAVPLFRAFVINGIVHPDNGEASRELARVVARDLLPLEPYRSYEIGLDEFFAPGAPACTRT